MGFDIYGETPTAKVGEYFRNNIWWWHDLAVYVLENCPFLPDGPWHTNDAHTISAEDALAIAANLDVLIANGKVEKYEKKFLKRQSEIPNEVCKFCNGTGKRPTDKNWDADSKWAKECGGCNACRGIGEVKPLAKDRHFSKENVRAFAEFCRYSGGFVIH